MTKKTIGLVGARGHVGRALLELIAQHPHLDLSFVGSRELDGQPVSSIVPSIDPKLHFSTISPKDLVARSPDLVILALPNGVSKPFVEALDASTSHTAILDLSADWRFDPRWTYGWPERLRAKISGAHRVTNPGCYATGMQTALWPLTDLLQNPAHIFGVSGYSGAGTEPSPRNDVERLRDNLMPYKLTGHIHEREVTHQLNYPVNFMPHVASFFRGITLTIAADLNCSLEPRHIYERWAERYRMEPLVQIDHDIPLVADAAHQHHVTLGGVHIDPVERRLVCIATLDNLLKGAATQALQNINLMLGLDEFCAIPLQPQASP